MPTTISSYCNRKKDTGRLDRAGNKILWLLSEENVKQLLDEAGITIDLVGRKRGQYVLGRFNDLGNYELGNCRFITGTQNSIEQIRNSENNQKRSSSVKSYWANLNEDQREAHFANRDHTNISQSHRYRRICCLHCNLETHINRWKPHTQKCTKPRAEANAKPSTEANAEPSTEAL